MQILHMNVRYRVQIHIAKNTGKTPKILILQPASGAALIDLDSQLILAFRQVRREVEIARRKAVFAVTDKLPVQPYIESRFNS